MHENSVRSIFFVQKSAKLKDLKKPNMVGPTSALIKRYFMNVMFFFYFISYWMIYALICISLLFWQYLTFFPTDFQITQIRGHSFQLNSYYNLTVCNHCTGNLWGVGNQGYQCDREYLIHSNHNCLELDRNQANSNLQHP